MSAFECASESGWKHIVVVLCHYVVKMVVYTIITANFKTLQGLRGHFLMVKNMLLLTVGFMWHPILTITYEPGLRRPSHSVSLQRPYFSLLLLDCFGSFLENFC